MQKNINILNKKARFAYEILDKYTAGIVLTGTEIKSIRSSKASIAESFCEFNDKGELFVINMTIEEYLYGTYYNHKPKATRKLLLNKRELCSLKKDVEEAFVKALGVDPKNRGNIPELAEDLTEAIVEYLQKTPHFLLTIDYKRLNKILEKKVIRF